MPRKAPALVLSLSMLLSGCLLGPSYRRPNVDVPAVVRGAPGADQASLADLPWWELFEDDTLKEIVKTALAGNYDLAAAVARVEQARQVAREARSQYFPTIDYTSLTSYGDNQFLGSPASDTQGAQGFFLGVARAAWEADIWGRIRRTNEAARAEYLATDEARRGVMLTLASDVAQAYFELLGLRLQLEISRENAQSLTSTFNLFSERLKEGIGNALQTSRAESDLATTNAAIPELERLIAIKENQIKVLMGQNPGPVETTLTILDEAVPLTVPAGLPSALLERRPDVLSAAHRVQSANAQIGIAQALFFPAIGLTTFFGKLSTPLSEITSSDSDAWSVGVFAAGPIFRGGSLRARKRQAVAQWEESRARYLQTALSAFRDVSDALISRDKFETMRTEQIRAVQAGGQAVELARTRYLEGLSSYIEVLEALQRHYPARLALVQTEINRRVVIVQLYKALGGGWNLSDARFRAADALPGAPGPPASKP